MTATRSDTHCQWVWVTINGLIAKANQAAIAAIMSSAIAAIMSSKWKRDCRTKLSFQSSHSNQEK